MSNHVYIGKRYVYPVLRPFPVWRKMLVNDTDEEWLPDWYVTRECPTPPADVQRRISPA